MIVMICGDWHGNTHRGITAIQEAAEKGISTIYQVGDFGLWPGQDGAKYLIKLQHYAKKHDVLVKWLGGNHENWDKIDYYTNKFGFNDLIPIDGNDHILYMPNGYREEIDGHTWLMMGGAVSIDKEYRKIGKSYWPQEIISDEDAQRGLTGGHADVMLTHDCPSDVIHDWMMIPNGNYKILNESQINRIKLQGIVDGVEPQWVIHGHLHYPYHKIVNTHYGNIHVVGLNMEFDPDNRIFFDTETLEVTDGVR
jgi:hypothetical protein